MTQNEQYEINKKTVRQLFAAIDAGDKESFLDAEHPEFTLKFTGYDKVMDREGHWEMVGEHATAFSDMKHVPELQVAEGDIVVTKGHITGTNDGPYHGRAATGKSVYVSFSCLTYMKDGKIIGIDSMSDGVAEYTQLYGPLY